MSVLLYIDPGTGSMLFTILLGLLTSMYYVFRKALMNVKFRVNSGKAIRNDTKIPIVIFTDSKRYWDMFKPICDEFEKRKCNVEYWTCSKDDPAFEMKYTYIKCEFLGDINRASARLNIMDARICLTTTPGIDVYQWKRSKNTDWYVHVIHGIGDATCYRMFGLEGFDAVLLAGEHQKGELESLAKIRHRLPKEMIIVGESHLDYLKEKLENSPKVVNDHRTVLLAPSWGKSSILVKYGERMIDCLKNTGYNIIVRPHPQSMISDKKDIEELIRKYPDDDKFSWDFSNDNFDSLNKADIMISDFSSVIWDYTLIFDKPILYADVSFDPAPYDLAWLDVERWDIKILPDVGIRLNEQSFADIKSLIDKAIDSVELKKGRESIRSREWGCPGESALRIVDYIIKKDEEIRVS